MVCTLKGGLCGARSALSSVVCIKGFSKLSDYPVISRYLKGIFYRYPPLPKCIEICDINQVLDYYTNLPDNEELEFKYIVKKLVMLFLVLGARRSKHSLPFILITLFLQIIKLLF